MAQRKSLKDDPCPMARSLEIVGDQWSLLVIRDAFDGMKRFGEFQQSLGVAKNILADRLKWLVQEGVLELVPASDGSLYQEYVLTPKGKGLFPWWSACGTGARRTCMPRASRTRCWSSATAASRCPRSTCARATGNRWMRRILL
jgi:DNA-binding HxlR family transcriptional regulator